MTQRPAEQAEWQAHPDRLAHPDRPGTVRIVVNGEPSAAAAGTTVAGLVAGLTTAATGIAVALNGTVVPRGRWEHERVGDGDSVEIVTAVQGG